MTELNMIITMALSSVLFALGGTEIPKFGRGFKICRRYLLPAFLAFICVLSHVSWWQALGYGLSAIVALSLGYGSSSPYWKKVLVFSSYGLVSLWVGFSWWVVATPIIATSLFFFSNWKPTASSFFWKSAEFLYGSLVGISLIAALQNRYL